MLSLILSTILSTIFICWKREYFTTPLYKDTTFWESAAVGVLIGTTLSLIISICVSASIDTEYETTEYQIISYKIREHDFNRSDCKYIDENGVSSTSYIDNIIYKDVDEIYFSIGRPINNSSLLMPYIFFDMQLDKKDLILPIKLLDKPK